MFNFKVMSTAENKKLIIRLRKKNKTYQEIADIIGKSRQRIHQIYKYPKEAQLFCEMDDGDDGMSCCGDKFELNLNYK